MTRSTLIGVLVLALGACGSAAAPDADRSPNSTASVAIPPSVQKIIDADFPPDGKIHVQSRRKFELRDDTYFCSIRGGFGLNGIDDMLEKLGQKSNYRGEGIAGENPSPECGKQANGHQIFVGGIQSMNRAGKHYKLTLAVWQGDPSKSGAYWVAGVERLEGRRPESKALDKPPALGDGECCEPDISIGRDISEFSKKFILSLNGG